MSEKMLPLRNRVRQFFTVQPFGHAVGIGELSVDLKDDELKVLVDADLAESIAVRDEKLNKEVPKVKGERLAYARRQAVIDALDAEVRDGGLKRKKADTGMGYVLDGERPADAPEGQEPKTKRLPIDQIRIDVGIQQRADGVDGRTVQEYADVADQLPPVRVFKEGDVYRLSRGFHRMAAWKLAGWDMVPVEIFEGDRDAAILDAAGDNADHGRRRTIRDIEKAIGNLLGTRKYKTASTTWLADTVRCAWATADKIAKKWRRDNAPPDQQGPAEVTGKDGRKFKARKTKRAKTTEAPKAAEAPKAPEKVLSGVKDFAGQDVPQELLPCWQDTRFRQALRQIAESIEYLKDYRADYAVSSLSVAERTTTLAEMLHGVETLGKSTQFAVCPPKPGEKFKAAARRGWMNKAEWDEYTADAKKAKKAGAEANGKPETAAPSQAPAPVPTEAAKPGETAPV